MCNGPKTKTQSFLQLVLLVVFLIVYIPLFPLWSFIIAVAMNARPELPRQQ